MATDLRVYDNEHGDPVVAMVTTGMFDVSRLPAWQLRAVLGVIGPYLAAPDLEASRA